MSVSTVVRKLVPRPARLLLRHLWVRQFQIGLAPMDLRFLSEKVSFSANDKRWNTKIDHGIGGWMPAANHSRGYHGILAQWWTAYGLGKSTLLVSETREVGAQFRARYPDVAVTTTDFYVELVANKAPTDVLWNLYEAVPPALASLRFGSVVCQATFEHLMDPVGVLRKLAGLVAEGGYVYLHTHTPLYGYHGWPRDYLRYFPDWFRDVPQVIPEIELVELFCVEGHAFAAYRLRA